jgi:tetratricopeptide (TPR) repeat protein
MVGRPNEAPPLVLKAITLSPRDPVIGVFYWILGRAYFVLKSYDDAIVWLRKSVELLPTVFYNRAYLLAAYALTGRLQQTEGITALREYKSGYSQYTVQRLRELYEKENPQDHPVMKDALEEFYRGLQLAGPPIPIQSYLVITPLGVADASLISLTLRVANADDSVAFGAVQELLSKGIEGWIAESVPNGDALLDQLAERFGERSPAVRAAIIAALDDRAAVLQFSDPEPLRASFLRNLVEGVMTFAKHPRDAIVGVIMLSNAIILIQVSVGVGEGLRTVINHAIVEFGDTIMRGFESLK